MRKKGLYSFAAVGAVLLIFVLHLSWSFWEPSGIRRDSWLYTLKVPPAAKTFPIWDAVDEPRYDIRIADGVKPSITAVHYLSSASLESLAAKAEVAQLACRRVDEHASSSALVCERSEAGRVIQVIVAGAPAESGSQVDVNFTGY